MSNLWKKKHNCNIYLKEWVSKFDKIARWWRAAKNDINFLMVDVPRYLLEIAQKKYSYFFVLIRIIFFQRTPYSCGSENNQHFYVEKSEKNKKVTD